LISDDLLQEIEGEIRTNRRVTIRELHHIIPEASKTTIHGAVTENLGDRVLCARWVPKMLTDDHRSFDRCEHQSFLRRIHGTTSSHFAESQRYHKQQQFVCEFPLDVHLLL